jgi:hypothetical protein
MPSGVPAIAVVLSNVVSNTRVLSPSWLQMLKAFFHGSEGTTIINSRENHLTIIYRDIFEIGFVCTCQSSSKGWKWGATTTPSHFPSVTTMSHISNKLTVGNWFHHHHYHYRLRKNWPLVAYDTVLQWIRFVAIEATAIDGRAVRGEERRV